MMKKLRVAVIATIIAVITYADTETDDFSYTLSDGMVTITGVHNITAIIEIPETIDDHPVVAIGTKAFQGCVQIKKVVIPDSVARVEAYAFQYCRGIESVVWGKGLKEIAHWAFSYCDGFANLSIPNGVETIGEYSFGFCSALETVTVPNSVKSVKWGAFASCPNLQFAYFPKSMEGKGSEGKFEDSPNVSVVYYNCQTPVAPPPVTSLSATDDGPGAICVSWDVDDETEVSTYKVFRGLSDDFASAEQIAELSGKCQSSYEDYDVSIGITNYYWIVAVNDIFEGEASGPAMGSCKGLISIENETILYGVELFDYEHQFSAEHGNGYLQWSVECEDEWESGLPPGLNLSCDGLLTGVPVQCGTYTFTVTCCDYRFPSASTSAVFTMEIIENDNRKPSIAVASPVAGVDVVLRKGASQQFNVAASDPDGQSVQYTWTVDGIEVQSGLQANTLLIDSSDLSDESGAHEIICYVNDDLWTNIVKQAWNVYVPDEVYVDAVSGNDENDGLTAETAFASIDAACCGSPYSTVHVAPGTYYGGLFLYQPITIEATNGVVTIDACGREHCVRYSGSSKDFSGRPVVRGCVLKNGAEAAAHVDLERCVITGNGAGWVGQENVEDEYYYIDESMDHAILYDCNLTRCTVAGNTTVPGCHPTSTNCTFDVTTIIWGNDDELDEVTDPRFTSLAKGDCRLRDASPYVMDGVVTRGALDDVVTGYVISSFVIGAGALDKSVAVVNPSDDVTFSVVDGSHPIDHFEVDGETVEAVGNSYTFSNVHADATLTAVFVSNVTFYVNVKNGNDSNDGFSKGSALASIQEAINRSANGDRIVVADGVYAPISTRNRRIVIESENGYKAAIIDGGYTNNCALLGGAEFNVAGAPIGYGELWQGTNTVLRGFTLCNGYGRWGAGVTAGTVENCLIINNTVEASPMRLAGPNGLGGGAYLSVLRNCTIMGNASWSAFSEDGTDQEYGGVGGGSCACQLFNCIEWKNVETAIEPYDDEWQGESVYENCCLDDPLFADAANGDYRLVQGSPCIVNGVVVAGCEPEIAVNRTYYVDAVNGSDEADGLEKVTALRSIQAAIDRAISGDTVIVADGVYAPINTNNKRIIIESEHGYKNTIIDGRGLSVCAWMGGSGLDYSVYSLENWSGNKTVLRGFTLRNGSGSCGAGAIGGTLENCLIIGNTVQAMPQSASPSGFGGGAYNSILRFCTVTGNASYSILGTDDHKWGGLGGGTYGCRLYGCIEWGNVEDPDDSMSQSYWDSQESEYDENCCLDDPHFADVAQGDYRLMPSSPCIVNGIVMAGCELGVVPAVPELTAAEVESWVSKDLAVRFAKSGESVADYESRFVQKFGADPIAAMTKATNKKDAQGNDMYVWQDYVAGTDPTDTNSVFTAKVEMVDGLPVVTWVPKLSTGEESRRTYTIYGKTNLTDKAWHSPTNQASRFFKVSVEMK